MVRLSINVHRRNGKTKFYLIFFIYTEGSYSLKISRYLKHNCIKSQKGHKWEDPKLILDKKMIEDLHVSSLDHIVCS